MKKFSVCYPIRTSRDRTTVREEILLGKHKDSPGARKLHLVGKWNGVGGKFEENTDKDIFDCAIRETLQESGLVLRRNHLYRAGIITFDNSGFLAEVHFFFASWWNGDLLPESEEMSEFRWFPLENLPYSEMMHADERFKLPLMLHEAMWKFSLLTCTIKHDADMKVIESSEFVLSHNKALSLPQH